MSNLWQQALELQGQMTKIIFDTRLTSATAELHDSTLTTTGPSAYTVNRIAGQPLDIAFVVRNSITKERAEKHHTERVRQLRRMGTTHAPDPG